ncbi:hypothetical protein ACVW0Y_003542 [Pseudomonas sp. TE3786]
MNYYPDRDGHIAVLDQFQTSTGRLLAEHLPQVATDRYSGMPEGSWHR